MLLSLSVAGFSLEFAILNVSGFYFYSVYSLGGSIYGKMGTGDVGLRDITCRFNSMIFSLRYMPLECPLFN